MSGLDAQRKAEFLPYVARAVRQARVPALYVSHSGDEVVALADRVLSINAGRIAGWRIPPMRLSGHVIAETPTGVEIRIDAGDETNHDERLVLPLRAAVGERVGLGLPAEGVLFSRDHPGPGSAALVLPAEHLREASESGPAMVRVLGQQLAVPESIRLPQGRSCWLSVLKVFPRPEPGDSPE
jgi:molybdate transport system ATP-binding protein